MIAKLKDLVIAKLKATVKLMMMDSESLKGLMKVKVMGLETEKMIVRVKLKYLYLQIHSLILIKKH